MMIEIASLQPRLSSYPTNLYHAKHRAEPASRVDGGGFYSHMLHDDIHKQHYAYETSFAPNGVNFNRGSELISALLNDFNHVGSRRDPSGLIFDLTAGFLKESVVGSKILLELHAAPNENVGRGHRVRPKYLPEENDDVLPSLGFIPNWSVRRSRAGLIQVTPGERLPGIIIPQDRVYSLELSPANLRSWARATKRLQFVDSRKLIGGGLDRLSWEGYSVSDVVSAQNLAVAMSTSEIGWDGRGLFAQFATSPYMTFRRLKFTRFWIEALQDVITFLNQFTTSDKLYGQEVFSFSISGLPDAEDLARAMQALRNGTLSSEQAYESYLYPKRQGR